MKGKLIILVGISNSGKSTFASKLAHMSPEKYIRVNRDDIRNLLYGYNDETVSSYYERDDIRTLEKQITRFEDTIIYDGLELGKTVIVDATHLTRAYIERFKYWNVETELTFFPIDLHEAFDRNSKRSRKVPNEVMKKQFNQFSTLTKLLEKEPIDFTPVELVNDSSKSNAYIFDIDGCLAEKGDRRSPFDWNKVGLDTPIESIVKLNQLVNSSKDTSDKVIIATGRDGICIEETEKWLQKHSIQYDEIYIRPKGDCRPDWEIKKEMAQEIVKNNYISFWADDRIQVTRYLRALGIKVLNVEYNNF
jgi:predicted kinase